MRKFLDTDFLLHSPTAETLFHDFAEKAPVIDYHNHLPPDQIAHNKTFENISQAWLKGDHYKWRVMRANGVPEKAITGDASDFEKFQQWANTVPYTIGNPLFHWTHLELRRVFGIDELLTPESAATIYEETTRQLRTSLPVRELLHRFDVRLLCTTDDPVDTLEFHAQLQREKSATRVLPTFRPDRLMAVEAASDFNRYVQSLEAAVDADIPTWESFLDAIKKRHDHFHAMGCRLSDHGLENFFAEEFTGKEVSAHFQKIRKGLELNAGEVLQFKSACLIELAAMDARRNWTQQFHVGAIRNNHGRLFATLGADSGTDSIGDFSIARPMARFFDHLDHQNILPKTIVYNLNPAWNEVFATMVANFNDGSVAGKMQYGSAWWFLDQKDGIECQLKTLSNMGLLSRFVGMVTDSRSFLSFPRHEYFRRILCNFIGSAVDKGELPHDIAWLGQTVRDICYDNAVKYFQF